MTRRRMWASVAALGAAGVTLGACGAAGSTASGAPQGVGALAAATGTSTASSCNGLPSVSATATGTASVTPDTLTMTLGVNTHSATAKGALESNNVLTDRLLSVLRRAGVAGSGLQTTGLSIFPNYVKNGKVSGYNVSNTVTATVTKLSSAGATIDSAANQVGNGIQFDNLSFSISNDSTPALAARTQAVKMAESRAQAMASAAGVTLGPICSISDQGSYDPIFAGNSGAFSASGGAGVPTKAVPVPVEPGSQQVVATVTVSYEVG